MQMIGPVPDGCDVHPHSAHALQRCGPPADANPDCGRLLGVEPCEVSHVSSGDHQEVTQEDDLGSGRHVKGSHKIVMA